MAKEKITKHHVPPTCPDPKPRFILKKTRRHHEAYHLLFGNAKSFEDAVEILKHDWWEFPDTNRNNKKDRENTPAK